MFDIVIDDSVFVVLSLCYSLEMSIGVRIFLALRL